MRVRELTLVVETNRIRHIICITLVQTLTVLAECFVCVVGQGLKRTERSSEWFLNHPRALEYQSMETFVMKKLLMLVIVSLTYTLLPSNCMADLVVTLDTAAQTFSFSGSDTGTLGTSKGSGIVTWGITATNASQPQISSDASWSGAGTFSNDDTRIFQNSSETLVQILFSGGAGAAGTLSFAGTPFSYAGFDPGEITNLESRIGTSLAMNAFGAPSGFSPISIVAAAVPEPTSFAIFGIAIIGLFRRRRLK